MPLLMSIISLVRESIPVKMTLTSSTKNPAICRTGRRINPPSSGKLPTRTAALTVIDEDILHFRLFAKYVAAFWSMGSSFSCSLERQLLLLFAALVVELRFVKAEFTRCGSNTDAFCKLHGFAAIFRRV